MPVITIAGHVGSGHEGIAQGLASRLQAPCIDTHKDIVEDVARYLQAPPEDVEEMQDVSAAPLRRVLSAAMRILARPSAAGAVPGIGPAGLIPSYSYMPQPLLESQYKQGLEVVVQRLALQRNMVLLGSAASLLLAGWPGAVHLFVTAPRRARVKRLMEQKQLTEREARTRIAAEDGSQKAYMKKFFGADVEDVGLYDMVLNTARVCTDAAVDLILSCVMARSDHSDARVAQANAS